MESRNNYNSRSYRDHARGIIPRASSRLSVKRASVGIGIRASGKKTRLAVGPRSHVRRRENYARRAEKGEPKKSVPPPVLCGLCASRKRDLAHFYARLARGYFARTKRQPSLFIDRRSFVYYHVFEIISRTFAAEISCLSLFSSFSGDRPRVSDTNTSTVLINGKQEIMFELARLEDHSRGELHENHIGREVSGESREDVCVIIKYSK